jgi:hypothetical protein
MDDRLPERTAAVLDSASTWHGVTWTRTDTGAEVLRLDGREFGRVADGFVEAAFPDRLPEAVVRHGFAERHDTDGWATRPVDPVADAVALLWLSYLSHLAVARRWRSVYPEVDVDEGLSEFDLSPGLVHLFGELERR